MRKIVFTFFVLGIFSLISCNLEEKIPSDHTENQAEAVIDTNAVAADEHDTIVLITPKTSELISYSNGFGIELFRRIASDDGSNLMLSPLSASAALTMLLNGCKDDTYTQIAEMLGYPANIDIDEVNSIYSSHIEQLLSADPKVTLALANAVFHKDGFPTNPSYLSTLNEYFDAQIQGLDFSSPSAVDAINQWASDNTNGKIDEVIKLIPPDAVMYLLNALYFKGDWTFQFHDTLTLDRPFYLNSETPIDVSTMGGNLEVKWHWGNGCSAIEIPYGDRDFSMVVIVPYSTIEDFASNFSIDTWHSITSTLDSKSSWSECNIYMPKFRFGYEKVLTDYLKSMGMVDAFSYPPANLIGISEEFELFVSMVKQNTFIEVSEQGTEAAAVTIIEVLIAGESDPYEYHIDRPFIFAIRERTTNTLLFLGRVMNPKE